MQITPVEFIISNHFDLELVKELSIEPFYYEKSIPKRHGGRRRIFVPDSRLLALQQALLPILNTAYDKLSGNTIPHTGINFRKISVVQHANVHAGGKRIFKTDVVNFYPSIKTIALRDELMSPKFGFNRAMANFIVSICTYKGQLMQGAATSPVLANMFFYRADQLLKAHSTFYGYKYSRYVDDIAISSELYINKEKITQEVSQIVSTLGLKLNAKKTRLVLSCHKQTVCNLTVNVKVNVCRTYIRRLRAILHHWEKEGIQAAANKHFGFDPTNSSIQEENYFIHKIKGMVNWVGQVKGKSNPVYHALQQRLDTLIGAVRMNPNHPEKQPFPKRRVMEKIRQGQGIFFDDMHGSFTATCKICKEQTYYQNYISYRLRGENDIASSEQRQYQFQCQRCGLLHFPVDETLSKDGRSTTMVCYCGGEISRDKKLICRNCLVGN